MTKAYIDQELYKEIKRKKAEAIKNREKQELIQLYDELLKVFEEFLANS